MFESNQPPSFFQSPVYHIQRHEIARIRQTINDLEQHFNTIYQTATYLGQNLRTHEDTIRYASALLELNQTRDSLQRHYSALNEMIQLANIDFGKTIPDQSRREIYHLYHAGRYTQAQLATQYQISQSAVSKIVNGLAPAPIGGVNPNGIANN
jgi:hypothetical protein